MMKSYIHPRIRIATFERTGQSRHFRRPATEIHQILLPLRFSSSASLTNRHSGTDRPSASESATLREGLRSKCSIKETILGAKSALSARASCERLWALRCLRNTTPKAFAKIFDRIPAVCLFASRSLQEQLFQFVSSRYCAGGYQIHVKRRVNCL